MDQENTVNIIFALVSRDNYINKLRGKFEVIRFLNSVKLSHKLDFADQLDAVVIVFCEVLNQLNGNWSLSYAAITFDDDTVATLSNIANEFVETSHFSPNLREIEFSHSFGVRHVAPELVAIKRRGGV